MHLEDAAVPLPRIGKSTLISALVCAGVCVMCMKAGFLTLLFLVPLGVCSIVFGPAAAWLGCVFAVLGNGVLALGFSLQRGAGLAGAAPDLLVFTVLVLGFTWIMAGNPLAGRWMPPLRTVFRFAAASLAGSLAFMGLLLAPGSDNGFAGLSHAQLEAITAGFIASSGTDAARQALLESLLTPDNLTVMLTAFVLRGGALLSAFFLYFFSRQAALIFARLFRRQGSNDLISFIAPRNTIWVLTLCLPVILIGRALSLTIIEVAAWNLLVICVIMFLAQGGGVVFYNLARRPMPLMLRLLCGLAFVFLLISPGINLFVIGLLVLIGIAENWLPLRGMRNEK
ncbi:MAG: hypothetical protein FWD36_07225 [Treponema sp.]|nr:hypothetical protein [Treponema sp.]